MKIVQSCAMAFCFSTVSICALSTPTVTVTGTPPSTPTMDLTILPYNSNPGSQSQQYYSNMNALYAQRAIIENCQKNKGSIMYKYALCENAEQNIYADSVLECPSDTNVTTTVNPVVGSVSASTSPHATCIKALKIDFDRKVSNCSKNSGHMQCKAYGAF
ncbi:MAG: hypothetical protein AAGC78_20060 [Cellvibrio sp.]|uniref:hypothetical protein n=1 Tax=Cellvibrio sp. TaxID=1965322 RepID=UPI0031A1FAAD